MTADPTRRFSLTGRAVPIGRSATGALFIALAIALSLAISALLVVAVGRDPVEVAAKIMEGAFRDARSFAGVVNFWIPLLLAATGLIVTFRAGLWNIGIEGQMMAGAIGATVVPMALLQNPSLAEAALDPTVLLLLAVVIASLCGALYALVAGVLKTWLGVNEIFGGVALNALINVVSIYLISGPWEPAIGGSAQMTERFPVETLYPSFSADFPASLFALGLGLVSILLVMLLLSLTRWGLYLRAVGRNMKSARLLGVPTERTMLTAFMVGGALAGIAGSYRVLFTFSSLRPLSSGGIGFLGLLVVLLIDQRAFLVPFATFAFAVILAGSTRLRVAMQLDASLAGVLQGVLVLLVMLLSGLRDTLLRRRTIPETYSDAGDVLSG